MYFIIKKSGHIYAADDLPENAFEKAKKEEFLIIDPVKARFLGVSGRWGSIPVVETDNKQPLDFNGIYKGGTIF